jgi:hypothetical protein
MACRHVLICAELRVPVGLALLEMIVLPSGASAQDDGQIRLACRVDVIAFDIDRPGLSQAGPAP